MLTHPTKFDVIILFTTVLPDIVESNSVGKISDHSRKERGDTGGGSEGPETDIHEQARQGEGLEQCTSVALFCLQSARSLENIGGFGW